MNNLKGKLIVLEGPEGAGKSLLCKNLQESLSFLGLSVLLSREPGGVKVAEKIREILIHDTMNPITEAYLFLAARAEHMQEVIKPALQRGDVVILDRFMYSTLVIQGYAKGLDIDELRRIHKLPLDGVYPDYAFFLDVPPEVGLARKFSQGETNKFELEGLQFHKKVYEGLNELSNKGELIRIDALRTPEEINNEVLNYILLN